MAATDQSRSNQLEGHGSGRIYQTLNRDGCGLCGLHGESRMAGHAPRTQKARRLPDTESSDAAKAVISLQVICDPRPNRNT